MNSASAKPRALILVRNTVSHDNRVLREAETLSRLGFAVLVAGVVSTAEPETQLEIDGARVIRLDPRRSLRDWATRWPRMRPRRPAASSSVTDQPAAIDEPPPRAITARSAGGLGWQLRLQRLAVSAAYVRAGAALAWRTSPALVHANDYNTMWVGIAAKLLCRSALLYDCHELWADRNGRPEWRPWLVACEALFVRVADLTIAASPGYAEELARRYRVATPLVVRNIPARRPGESCAAPLADRVTVSPGNGRRGDRRSANAPKPDRRQTTLAVYVGGLMPGRGLEPVIDALALVPEVRVRLIGPGRDSYRAGLWARARAAGVAERIEIEAAVPPSAVVDTLSDADLGLMLIQPVCRSYELTLPNKLFEYAAAGLPILASDLPVIGPVVREAAIGEVVAPADIDQIAASLRRLAEPTYNQQVRERVRTFARRFTWERERETLAGAYLELVPGSPTM